MTEPEFDHALTHSYDGASIRAPYAVTVNVQDFKVEVFTGTRQDSPRNEGVVIEVDPNGDLVCRVYDASQEDPIYSHVLRRTAPAGA